MNPLPPHIQILFNQAQAAFAALAASAPSAQAKASIDAWMAQTLSGMGAVPRAEFELQREMLLHLRERVNQLESKLAAQG